jgi:hypothetical protein
MTVQTPTARRPEPGEYDPFYADYVGCVPDGDVLATLAEQRDEMLALLAGLSRDVLDHRYAAEKWSVCEVVGHLMDAERVFAYRALRFARADQTPLLGMDQEVFIAGVDFGRRPGESLGSEYGLVRSANLALFESFDETVLDRTGVASDCPFTVRSLLWVIAGHERHHLDVLRERYL